MYKHGSVHRTEIQNACNRTYHRLKTYILVLQTARSQRYCIAVVVRDPTRPPHTHKGKNLDLLRLVQMVYRGPAASVDYISAYISLFSPPLPQTSRTNEYSLPCQQGNSASITIVERAEVRSINESFNRLSVRAASRQLDTLRSPPQHDYDRAEREPHSWSAHTVGRRQITDSATNVQAE